MNAPGGTADSLAVKYRPDIDGLRALAILPVVWFHSNLPGLPGGFTGVDTFFVISGYLITLIIHREVQSGTFSFARFYERRVRRIAPALLLVSAVSSVAAYALLLPYELVAFSQAQIASLGMVSNLYFWRTGNYFALADAVTPLLHTWSLGVEEQFYLAFPLALIVAERLRATKPAVAGLLVASFALCVIATARSPAAAFYLLPTRGWELMVGASLAVGLVAVPASAKSAVGVAGLSLIVAGALWLSADDPFPGWRATIPALGAAALIASGPDTLVGRVLAARPIVYVGKVSYSFYLWHWPVFAFLRHYAAEMRLSPPIAFGGIVLAFGLSAVTYRLVEQPARQRSISYRFVLFACGTAACAITLAALLAIATKGLPQRFSSQVVTIAAQHDAYAPLAHSCTDIGFQRALESCHIGPPGARRFILWGDSHAAALSDAVASGLDQPGVVISMGSCAPALGWVNPRLKGRDPATCRDLNARTLALVEGDPGISTVILSAFWVSHERTGGADFWRGTQALVDQLRRRGKRVVVIAGIPDPEADVPWASAIRERFSRDPLRLSCPRASIPLRGASVVDVSREFCRGDPAWRLFTDSNHVSRYAGRSIIAPALAAAVR